VCHFTLCLGYVDEDVNPVQVAHRRTVPTRAVVVSTASTIGRADNLGR
jgi:hypothetical protein